jgi:chemotaxis protein methyltransferase CheR
VTPLDFDFIAGMVQSQSAIVLEGKEYLISSRLQPIIEREGLGSLTGLVERLRGEPHGALARKVVEAMATNETLFFRDPAVFEALRRQVLPELIEARRSERQLTIWSAACSTGQEPYSVAMLLDTELAGMLRGWKVQLHATDLSAESLERARNGVYSQLEVDRGLPLGYRQRYFRREGTSWRLDDSIRRMVELRQANLKSAEWPLGGARPDLVLLRNVLYYFAPADKKAILARVRKTMHGRGVLLVGSTENLTDDDGFTAERVGATGQVELFRPAP